MTVKPNQLTSSVIMVKAEVEHFNKGRWKDRQREQASDCLAGSAMSASGASAAELAAALPQGVLFGSVKGVPGRPLSCGHGALTLYKRPTAAPPLLSSAEQLLTGRPAMTAVRRTLFPKSALDRAGKGTEPERDSALESTVLGLSSRPTFVRVAPKPPEKEVKSEETTE